MKNKIKTKRAVFIYLFLHSAIVATLIVLLTRGGDVLDNSVFTIAVAVGTAALTLYTTHTVIQSMTDEITHREKALSKTSANLKIALTVVGECARELEKRITVISECGRELEQRANVISEFSDRINVLIKAAGLADGDSAHTANSVANNNSHIL